MIEQIHDLNDKIYIAIDSNGDIQWFNNRVSKITGYTESELKGMSLTSDLIPDVDINTVRETIMTGQSADKLTFETELITINDTRVQFEFECEVITGAKTDQHVFIIIGKENDDLDYIPQGKDATEAQDEPLQTGTKKGKSASKEHIEYKKRTQRFVSDCKRILKIIHTNMRGFGLPENKSEIFKFAGNNLSYIYSNGYVGVYKINLKKNQLELACKYPGETPPKTLKFADPIQEESSAIWQAYKQRETKHLSEQLLTADSDRMDLQDKCGQAFPIGNCGVAVVYPNEEPHIQDTKKEIAKVVTTTAASGFQRLQFDNKHTEIENELSAKENKIAKLKSITDILHKAYNNITHGEKIEYVSSNICEELTDLDYIDFAWVGQTNSTKGYIKPVASSDKKNKYFTYITNTDNDKSGELPPPEYQAVREEDTYIVRNIYSLTGNASWHRHALNNGFVSVASYPFSYNNSIEGVLSVYSASKGKFDTEYHRLLDNLASLLGGYVAAPTSQYTEDHGKYTAVKFSVSDNRCILYKIANELNCQIRVTTLLSVTAKKTKLLLQFADTSVKKVINQAESISAIADVCQIETSSDHLKMSLKRPNIFTHAAEFNIIPSEVIAEPDGITFYVNIASNISNRVIINLFDSQYEDLLVLSQQQIDADKLDGVSSDDPRLTDRQREVLFAAIEEGYFDVPKRATGDDIAELFDISSTSIHNHIKKSVNKIVQCYKEDDRYDL